MADIELVIKIPEQIKQAFDKAESNDLKGGYYDHGGIIGKAIQDGTPLDSVKAEIKRMEYHMIDCDVLVSQEEVLDILDNIGKAENEGV